MLCHTLVISVINIAQVNQRVAHLILSTFDEGVDNAGDTLVTHDMYVHGHPVGIRLTRHSGQFLFFPVGQSLMTVRIKRLHKSRTRFHRAVHEELNPVRLYARGSVFLDVGGIFQRCIHIRPTFNFVAQTQYHVQVARLIHLLGGLIEIGVKEIVAPAIDIHRIAFSQQPLFDFWNDAACHVNGKETFVVQVRTGESAGLFLQITGRSAVGTHHNLAAADILVFLEHRAVLLHNTSLHQHDGIDQCLMTFIVCKVNRKITADSIYLLTGRHIILEIQETPAEAKDRRCPCLLGFLDCSGKDFRQEFLRAGITANRRSDNTQGIGH